jgi:hypothetical protein
MLDLTLASGSGCGVICSDGIVGALLACPRLSVDRAGNAVRNPARKATVRAQEDKVSRETDSPLEGRGFEPSVPREEKAHLRCPKKNSAPYATRIGDGDIGPNLKYDGSGLKYAFSSGSSCTNAVEIAGHYALAAPRPAYQSRSG